MLLVFNICSISSDGTSLIPDLIICVFFFTPDQSG